MSGDNCLLQCLYSRTAITCAEALLHGKCPDLACWWEAENKMIVFFFTGACVNFHFCLINCPISTYEPFSIIFSFPSPAGKGEWQRGFVGTCVQPRSTHHADECANKIIRPWKEKKHKLWICYFIVSLSLEKAATFKEYWKRKMWIVKSYGMLTCLDSPADTKI